MTFAMLLTLRLAERLLFGSFESGAFAAPTSMSSRAPGGAVHGINSGRGVVTPLIRSWIKHFQFVLAMLDYSVTGLWHFVPSPSKIAEWLRDNKPCFFRKGVEYWIIRILCPQSTHLGGIKVIATDLHWNTGRPTLSDHCL